LVEKERETKIELCKSIEKNEDKEEIETIKHNRVVMHCNEMNSMKNNPR
jgi:hypothetical protein